MTIVDLEHILKALAPYAPAIASVIVAYIVSKKGRK
jgi:hypothetical protein